MSKPVVNITCPECGTTIPMSDTAYNQIVNQVCNAEVESRVNSIKAEYDSRLKKETSYIQAQAKQEYETALEEKRRHFEQLKHEKNSEIASLEAKLSASNDKQKLAVSQMEQSKNQEISALRSENAGLKQSLSNKDSEMSNRMQALKATLENDSKDKLIKLSQAKDAEISDLRNKNTQLETSLQLTNDELDALKNFKSKLSTKMIGETLEEHCKQSYDRLLRPILTSATFEKDNTPTGGTKGDFIYRELDNDGNEFVSIMFEMKNEDDASSSKKCKNDSFFDKLDKDRSKKKCEYAVLVSLLEPDNDIYNAGISIVSDERYDKMFVVRPQHFADVIFLIRRIAKDTLSLKQDLELERCKAVDVNNFEDNLNAFKDGILKNCAIANTHCADSIKYIDKTIESLEKIKEKMVAWEKQNEVAAKKADDLTIKTLTKSNPTVAAMFSPAPTKSIA